MSAENENNDVYEFPVSPTQGALWVLNQMMPENPAYNIPVVARLTGKVDVPSLKKALIEIVNRYEILRTSYAEASAQLLQLVHKEANFKFHEKSYKENNKALGAFLTEQIQKQFDLENGEIIRAGLLKESEQVSVFYMVIHHVAVDHSAILMLSDELAVLYEAYSKGASLDLAGPELQYVDYVIWNEENKKAASGAVELWKENLKDFSGVISLPTDRARLPMPTGKGDEFSFSFTTYTSEKIKAFSRSNSASLYQVLMSALNVLLARNSGQKDIIVGTPFSNRQDNEDLEKVIGCFINTLPIAINLKEDFHFVDCLAEIKKAMLFAYENQSVPFNDIVNASVETRDLSFNPLFQVGFVFQEPPAAITLAGLKSEIINIHTGGAMYDLHLWLWEDGDKIKGVVWYNTDIFKEQTITRFIESYEAVVNGLIDAPNQSVFSVDYMTGRDVNDISLINETKKQLLDAPLPALITKQAEKNQSKVAAIFSNGCKLTYAELEERSDCLASKLINKGVKVGSYVGISVERNEYMLIGLLAILKSGAAYVPLDPEYPEERLQYMVDTAAIELLLITEGLENYLPKFSGEKFILNNDSTQSGTLVDVFESRATVEGLAYVIFTSGSTGKPKGVQVPHGAVSNFLQSMAGVPGCNSDKKLLAVTTLSFDIAVLELYLPLITGGTVVVADSRQASDGIELDKLIKDFGINIMQATPSTWRGLLAAGFDGASEFKILCGGEAFPEDLVKELMACSDNVWNMYGPTETTVWSTCYKLPTGTEQALIGKPIANTSCYVLDKNLQQVPVGVYGELYIGGAGVTLGYLGQPDLTEERFIANPYGEGRLYQTGDLVRQLSSGEFEYSIRIDNQVKVRGFRIELGEIESKLAENELIAQVVVNVKDFSSVDQRLIAYVKFIEGEKLTNTDVRRFLRQYLPDYMIPQLLVEMADFPLTPNGKVDRKALPSPFASIGRQAVFHEPETPIQKRVAEIWTQQLQIEKISLTDNFFDIGGHSLLSMMVVHLIESEFSIKLSPADMISNTLEQLANQIEKITGASYGLDTKIEPDVNNGPPTKKANMLKRLFGKKG